MPDPIRAPITLTAAQINQLRTITRNGTANFPAGYQYMHSLLRTHPQADSQTRFWFQQAANINRNSGGSAIFIRTYTNNAIRISRLAPRNMQNVSNGIATAVIGDILASGQVSDLSVILNDDIRQVLDNTGIPNLGGWGGSFYYWNTAIYNPDGTPLFNANGTRMTVGDSIRNTPAARSLFIETLGHTLGDMAESHIFTALGNPGAMADALGRILSLPNDIQDAAFAVARRESDAFNGIWMTFFGLPPEHPLYGQPIGIPMLMLGSAGLTLGNLSTDPALRQQQITALMQAVASLKEAEASARRGEFNLGDFLRGVASGFVNLFTGNALPIDYSGLGSVLGSSLGDVLANGDKVRGIVYSSLLGEIGERLGDALDAGGTLENAISAATRGGLDAFGTEVGVRAAAGAIGTVSSWLSMELGEALGLEGFGADLFTTTTSTVTSHIIGNLLAQGPNFAFAGLNTQEIGQALGGVTGTVDDPAGLTTNLASALANAVGAFIGARLGSMVVSPQTQAGAVLASIGSSVGAYLATNSIGFLGSFAQTIGTALSAKIGWLGNLVAPGIGAFVGFVLGALIGNLFGRKKPKIPSANASTFLNFTTGEFELGASSAANGGNLDLVRSMATSARDTLNGFLTVMRGDFSSATQMSYSRVYSNFEFHTIASNATTIYGHTGNQLWIKLGSTYSSQINVASADIGVEKAIFSSLAATHVVGGDLLAKRAIAGFIEGGGQDITVLLGNLQIASDYRFYGSNRDAIDSYIQGAYSSLTEAEQSYYAAEKALIDKVQTQGQAALTSGELGIYTANKATIDKIVRALDFQAVANPWIITLQRAVELGLDDYRASDFFGGVQGFLMSFDLASHGAVFEDISLSQVGSALRLSLPGTVEDGLFSILPQASADGRSIDITDFFDPNNYWGSNAVGFMVSQTGQITYDAFSSGIINDFVDQSLDTAGVVIADYMYWQEEQWSWVNPYTGMYEMLETPILVDRWATGGDDVFLGGSGNDTLQGYSGWDWLSGGAGADMLQGMDDNDVLLGGSGSDVLYGGTGIDYLAGGDGNDGLYGEAGADILVGGAGSDTLSGGDGDDVLLVDQNDYAYDSLAGDNGRDALSFERWSTGVTFALGSGAVADDGYSGVEDVIGSRLTDSLTGDGQANRLAGAGGDDTLQGGDGDDTLEGGDGADALHGGAGVDTASFESSRVGVFVDLEVGDGIGGDAEGDTFFSIENVRGSRGSDDIRGDAGANVIEAGAGDDWMVATRGSDTYNGGDGLDTLDFSAGDFETGTSTTEQWVDDGYYEYDYWLQEYVWISNGGHYETVTTTVPGLHVSGNYAAWRGTDGATGLHNLVDVEHIVGTDAADHIALTAAAEFLTGGKGNDFLAGGAGADTYFFSAGDGYDTVSDSHLEENIVSFSSEIGFNSLSFSYAGGANGFLDIYYGPGDTVHVYGNFYQSANNQLKIIDMAGAGQLDVSQIHHVIGGATAGGDTLYGLAGYYDLIAGYGGDDTIYGSGGSWEDKGNVILGGTGNDWIVTSAGDDQFAFERGSGRDTITDAGGEDTIVFGPNVEASDVIYKVVGNDLYVGIAEDANPTYEAHQVADYVRIVNGAIRYQNVSTGVQALAGVEFLNAGGSWIDLGKLSIDWVTSYTSGWPPIVFDLQGDGLDIIGVDQSKIVSKLESGFLARTSWVGPTDGFLAVDRDGDGQINRTSEISFLGDKAGAKTDLEGLQAWDTNGDGKISALDDGWSKLKLWVDVNQNGRSTTSELKTLDEAGIVEINLTGTPTGSSYATSGGDTFVHNTLSFTWASGQTGRAHDVELGRKLIGGEGLSLDELRAAWGDGTSDAELGRLITEYRLERTRPADIAAWLRGRTGDLQLDPGGEVDDRARLDHSGDGEIELGFGGEDVVQELADFTDHDELFAEDLARQLERLRTTPFSTEVDEATRASLKLLTDGIGSNRFERPSWKDDEADGAPGYDPVGLQDTDLPAPDDRTAFQRQRALDPAGGGSVQRTRMAGADLESAAARLSAGDAPIDPWAAASVTLASADAGSRWWAQAIPENSLGTASTGGLRTGQYAAEQFSIEADPSTLSAHQKLTQAIAAFGPRSGAGAAVWKRSGETADYVDASADARHARWNLNAPQRMAG